MKPPGEKALTVTELLVALAVIGILAFAVFIFFLPQLVVPSLTKGQMTQTLSNMKQLHLATQQMALDGIAEGNTNLGWPGDTGGSFSNWARLLVQSNYLSMRDLNKLLSAPGIVVPPEKILIANTTAVRVYAAKEKDPGEVVFLTSANFTNTPDGGLPPLTNAKPYGNKGFVVFRKAGDGAILQARQAGNTNLIGNFVPLCQ